MTNEQLIIYIYGIYPEGGLSGILAIFSIAMASFIGILWVNSILDEKTKPLIKWSKRLWVITAIVITVGYFIPSKNVFLAMVATPTLIESLENKDGKLHKVNKLLDMALDQATKELKEK